MLWRVRHSLISVSVSIITSLCMQMCEFWNLLAFEVSAKRNDGLRISLVEDTQEWRRHRVLWRNGRFKKVQSRIDLFSRSSAFRSSPLHVMRLDKLKLDGN